MTWTRYPSIKRMGNEEVENILLQPEIWIEPKIDGANAALFIGADGLECAKRSAIITDEDKGFRGFKAYIESKSLEFMHFFDAYPKTVLYGEWLVKHTIGYYDQEAYGKFYVFDILDLGTGYFIRPDTRLKILSDFDIEAIPILAKLDGPIEDQSVLNDFIGQNKYLIPDKDKIGEGIVIKSYTGETPHICKFGRPTWAKLVRSIFREKCKKEFPVDSTRNEPEETFINNFVVGSRIEKIKQKIQDEKGTGWQSKYIGQLLGMVWHDIFTEELWDFVKKNKVRSFDFRKAQSKCTIKIKILEGL